MAQGVCSPEAIGHTKVVADGAKCLPNRGHVCCGGRERCVRHRCEPLHSHLLGNSSSEPDTPTESTSATTTLTTTLTTTAGSGAGSTMVPPSGNGDGNVPDTDDDSSGDHDPDDEDGDDEDGGDEDGDAAYPDNDAETEPEPAAGQYHDQDDDDEGTMMPGILVAGYGFGFQACLKRGTQLFDASKSSLCCSGIMDWRTRRCLPSNRCVAAAIGHRKVIGDRDRCIAGSDQLCCGGPGNCINRRCVPGHILNTSAGDVWVHRPPKATSPDLDPSQAEAAEAADSIVVMVVGIVSVLLVLLSMAWMVRLYLQYKAKMGRKAARHVARLARDKTRSAGAAAAVEAMTAAVAEDAGLVGQKKKKLWMPHISLQETPVPGARPATTDCIAKTDEDDLDWENQDGGAWDAYCNMVMEAKASEALLAERMAITDC